MQELEFLHLERNCASDARARPALDGGTMRNWDSFPADWSGQPPTTKKQLEYLMPGLKIHFPDQGVTLCFGVRTTAS